MPLSDDDVKIRAIRRGPKKLSPQDEQFLRRCWRRDQNYLAREVLCEKLVPLAHHKVRNNNKLGNNDIAYEAGTPRHERPLGRSYEMLSEAFCGRELPSDNGRAVPRGILGAIDRCNENRGDVANYIHGDVKGTTADFIRAEMARGFVDDNGNPPKNPINCMSHSRSMADSDGATYLDILLPPPIVSGGTTYPDPMPYLDQMPSRDQAVLRSLILENKTKVDVSREMGISRPTLDSYREQATGRLRAAMESPTPEPMSKDETTFLHFAVKTLFGDELPPGLHGRDLEGKWQRYMCGLWRRNCALMYQKPSGRRLNSPQELERQFFTADGPHYNAILGRALPYKLVLSNAHDGSMGLWTISAKKHKHYSINAPALEALAKEGMKGVEDVPNYDPESKGTHTIKAIGGFLNPQTAGVDYDDLDDAEKKRIKKPRVKKEKPERRRKPVDRTWRIEDGCMIIPAGARTKVDWPSKYGCAKSAYGGKLILNRNVAEEPGDYLYARLSRAKDARARVEVLAQHRVPFIDEQEHQLPLAA